MSSFLLIQHSKYKSNSIPIIKYTGILKIFFSFISTLKLQVQVFENLFLMSMCYESNWHFTTSILLCLGDELLVEGRYMKWVQTQERSNNELPNSWLLWWLNRKESTCNAEDMDSFAGSGRSLGKRKWQPIPVFLTGKSHGQRNLAGYSPRGHKESDMFSN